MTPVVLLMLACKVPAAPEDVDGLAHWFWENFDHEDHSIFASGIANLDAALDGSNIDGRVDGQITGLSLEELELVGKEDEDPAAISGVYLSNLVSCPLSAVDELTWAPNQDELHEGTYESYERVFTSDHDAYLDREVDTLTWTSTYHIVDTGLDYYATINGTLRYLDDLGDDTLPPGPLLISRGVLEEPALFDEDDPEKGMFQDYQLEVFYERAPGETVHMYVMWRQMHYLGMEFSNKVMQTFVLNGLEDWDDDADDYCEDR